MFCALNGYELAATADDAVSTVLAIAAGELDEQAVGQWLNPRLRSERSDQ